jgi:hypothetical protein
MAGGIRGILTLVALLIAVALERFATFGARSLYTSQIIAEDSSVRFARFFPLITVVTIVGFFIAVGITALAKNARITMVVGCVLGLVASVSFLVMDSPKHGALLLALASGVIRLCPYVIAGEVVGEEPNNPSSWFTPTHRIAGVAAFVMAILFVSQGAGSLSGVFFHVSHLDGAAAFQSRYFVVLGLMMSSLLFAIGVLVIHFAGRGGAQSGTTPVNDPYRAPATAPEPPQPQAPIPTWGHPSLAGLAILFFAAAIFTLANDFGNIGHRVAIEQGLTASTLGTFHMVESGIATVVSLVFAIVFLVTASTRGRMPPLYFLGVGLLVAGLGTIVKSIGGLTAIYVLGAVLDGLSTPLGVIGAAYAVTALRGHPRSMFVLAIWYTMLMQTSLSASSVSATMGSRIPAMGAGLLALIAGGVFLPLMKRVQNAFFVATNN